MLLYFKIIIFSKYCVFKNDIIKLYNFIKSFGNGIVMLKTIPVGSPFVLSSLHVIYHYKENGTC
jgi:hypothetical protein